MAAALAAPTAALHAETLSSIIGERSADGWAGFYAGATFGVTRSTGEASRGDFSGTLIRLDVQNGLFPSSIEGTDVSGLGGGTLGYNLQRGALVGGIEVDYAVTGSDVVLGFSRIDPNPEPPFNGLETITGYETEVDGLGTIRLRAGRDFGGLLVYATGGMAVGRVENRFTLDLPGLGYSSPDWSEAGTRYGYAVGAGVEQRLSGGASLKVEVIYYDLDDSVVEGRDPDVFEGEAIDYRFDNAGLVGRLGVNIRF